MLVTSIFSFSHSVFYLSKREVLILITVNWSFANSFKSRILSFGKGLYNIIIDIALIHRNSLRLLDKAAHFLLSNLVLYWPQRAIFIVKIASGVNPLPGDKVLDWSKLKQIADDILTHYQTTNFRLFQSERVCRRQFQIWRKWKKVIQTYRKHCGKRRNCSLRAISPFSTVFSTGLFPRGVKRFGCVGIG